MFNKKIIRHIKDKYYIDRTACRPTVNEKLDNSVNRVNIEIACLITQIKDIYFTSKTQILNKLDPTLKSYLEKLKRINYFQYFLSKPVKANHGIVMIPCYKREGRTIIYNNRGTRQAFLLFLRDTKLNLNEFLNPGSWAESDNHYLTGMLLSYPKGDILFFYKVAGYKEYLLNNDKLSNFNITEKKAFASWPTSIKSNFYTFLKTLWLKSTIYKMYKRDRKEADEWLKNYEHYSLKRIKTTIKELQSQIAMLISNY